ncbi:hypothetical protein [Spiroplasma floricola]|uniref:Pr6Pr family membrane protein n=1 Tax=Spiroplasma floricola 23-6 TaxID=1336749 RepID=A0A2K8SDK5_9MOLU|nr:hypothetical protein [Spiroplasma floricola]AUB31541.1 hypothetical protein SFLOR_v1c04890 [Spiroplasma floricola 23-6]
MKNKVWYKNWLWYSHLVLAVVFLSFLIWGLYLCAFKEFWYIDEWSSNRYSLKYFTNFDVLMSFFSVQVNIMTIVWLIFYVLNFNKRNYGVTSTRFRMTIMNLNLIVFIIFWVGIIYFFSIDPNELSRYTKGQIACTIVTHFIAPLTLIALYWFTMGEQKYNYLDLWKKWDLHITILYSFLYMIYVYVRGTMYEKDYFFAPAWPYPFLNFNNLFVGNSVVGYMLLLCVIFIIWIVAHHSLLIFINNLAYKNRNKNKTSNKISKTQVVKHE